LNTVLYPKQGGGGKGKIYNKKIKAVPSAHLSTFIQMFPDF